MGNSFQALTMVLSIVLAVIALSISVYCVIRSKESVVAVVLCACCVLQALLLFSVLHEQTLYGMVQQVVIGKGYISEESIRERAVRVDRNEILRNPDEYIGEYIIVDAYVSFIVEDDETGTVYYVVNSSPGEDFSIELYGLMEVRRDTSERILQGDYIRAYGRIADVRYFNVPILEIMYEAPVVEVLFAEVK